VVREGNIHETQTIIGGRDLLAVEHTGMKKMGLNPAEDRRFYGLAKEAFGERPFEVRGDLTPYENWLNVGALTADLLDIGEEIPVMAHFLGESMAHVSPIHFPPRSTTWVRKLMHAVGRYFFLRKVRSRQGVRVLPPRQGSRV